MARFIDAGINLASSRFDKDLAEVLERATEAGVEALIAIGCDVPGSHRCLRLSRAFPQNNIVSTAGIHPHQANTATKAALDALAELVAEEGIVAVGETGLDFNRNYSTPGEQRQAFAAQLELAAACGKPVYLHERDAFKEQIAMLSGVRQRLRGGLAHCFTGSREQARTYLDLGLFIGITGWVCDPKRGQALRDTLPYIPLDRIVLETDAPYLIPRHLKKAQLPTDSRSRNEPALLPTIAHYAAELLGIPPKELAEQTSNNVRALFAI